MSAATRNIVGVGQEFLLAGWQPLALTPRSKSPRHKGWQDRYLSEADIAQEFATDDNIGLRCGRPSGGLIDIDIDDPLALDLAAHYLPETQMRHGRSGNPNSHYWYVVDEGDCKTSQFRDPEGYETLIELRGTGGQTMVPPSVHPEGEPLVWSAKGEPARVTLASLSATVRRIAAGALLARHWPSEGGRNAAALALGGALLRGGMTEAAATEFVELIADAAGDEECVERAATVKSSAAKLHHGEAVTGFSKLKEMLGEKCASMAFLWLREAGDIDPVSEWEAPILFTQAAPPDVPASLLPGKLGTFAQALADMAEVPEALAVFMVLGIVGAAASRRFIVTPKEGWSEHVNIYTAIALPPANNKSLVTSRATKPLVAWESSQREEMQPKIVEARSKRKSEEKFIERKRKTMVNEADAIKRQMLVGEIADLEAALTEVPVLPKLFANDATPESLATNVAEQGDHFSIISDEGGIIETLSGLYSNGNANLDIVLKGIDGGETRVRRQDRAYDIRPVLSFILAIQPQILVNMAERRAFNGNGLLDRFLFLVPESKLGFRTLEGPPIADEVSADYQQIIHRLLDMEPSRVGQHGYHTLTLSPSAAQVWQEFRRAIERELRPAGRLADACGWGGKLAGFALRIAAQMHLADNPLDQLTIAQETMERALQVSNLLIEHRLAAQQLMGSDLGTHDAKYLYDWITREGNPKFTRTDCLRANHGRFKEKKRLDLAFGVLIDRRIVNRCARGESAGAGRPAEVYEVNPLIFDRK